MSQLSAHMVHAPRKNAGRSARTSRRANPSIFDALRADPTTPIDRAAAEELTRDMGRWSRRYLFPWIRLLTRLLIPMIMAVKRILPFLGSEKALSIGTLFFARHFVGPEAQRLFLRHFVLEANVINFIARNSGAAVPESDLRPTSIEGVGEWQGVNAIALHDANATNLIIDLGDLPRVDVRTRRPLRELDFSMLDIPDIEADQSRTWLALDLQSSVYIALFFIVLFFDDRTLERAINSLQLDECMLTALAELTGEHTFRAWVPGKFPMCLGSPTGDVARELHLHMLVHEYAHGYLLRLKAEAEQGRMVS